MWSCSGSSVSLSLVGTQRQLRNCCLHVLLQAVCTWAQEHIQVSQGVLHASR